MKTLGYILFFCQFTLFVNAQSITEDSLQTGDLVFLDLDCGPLCDAIESVTPDYEGHSFTHVGIIFIKDHQPYVVEATGKQVQVNTLKTVTARSIHPVFIGRLKPAWQKLRKKAVRFAKKQVGIPYDDNYLMDNGKYYCSELVYEAFKSANHHQEIFRLFPMTYKAPRDTAYFPAWVQYFKQLHQPIPQGKPGCNPGSIAISPQLNLFALK